MSRSFYAGMRPIGVAIIAASVVVGVGFLTPLESADAATGVSRAKYSQSSTPAGAAVTVAGQPLDRSVQPEPTFAVAVSAPDGVKSVKFDLDGVYIGQSSISPYSFSVTAAGGTHRLDVHWSGPYSARLSASFTVAGSSTTQSASASKSYTDHSASVMPQPAGGAPAAAPPTITSPKPSSPASAAVINVSTSAGLSKALGAALPGQTIELADGLYAGTFVASATGTEAAPITLHGSQNAILTSGGVAKGYGLHITGSYWVISGIAVTESGKGIVLDGSMHTVISGVDVGHIGDEGVHFRHGSSFSSIVGSSVHDTGVKSPGYGEGIYIGSAKSNWASVMGSSSTIDTTNNVLVQGNYIFNTAAEGIDVKEGTTGGRLLGNFFSNAGYSGVNSGDSWVDVKGNGYMISGNSGSGTKSDAFQVHQQLVGWGNGNRFSNNTVISGVPGYLVMVGPGAANTGISCQSTTALLGLSNIACAP